MGRPLSSVTSRESNRLLRKILDSGETGERVLGENIRSKTKILPTNEKQIDTEGQTRRCKNLKRRRDIDETFGRIGNSKSNLHLKTLFRGDSTSEGIRGHGDMYSDRCVPSEVNTETQVHR